MKGSLRAESLIKRQTDRKSDRQQQDSIQRDDNDRGCRAEPGRNESRPEPPHFPLWLLQSAFLNGETGAGHLQPPPLVIHFPSRCRIVSIQRSWHPPFAWEKVEGGSEWPARAYSAIPFVFPVNFLGGCCCSIVKLSLPLEGAPGVR